MANKIKIYLAAPWVTREATKATQKQLEDAGFDVVSRWITKHVDVTENASDAASQAELQKQAIEDILDLESADVFIIMNTAKSEGKAFEFGYAYACGTKIILVGDLSNNIFYRMPHVKQVDTIQDAIQHLRGLFDE